MSEIDWDKAPEGAEHYVEGWGFFKFYDGEWWVANGLMWQRTPYKSPENFSWFGAAVQRPSPAWSGEGLPPVGVVCEFQNGMGGWSEVEITAIAKLGVCFVRRGREGENYVSLTAKFRPIRTPEQIAADEREAAVLQMLKDAGRPDSTKTRDQARLLYDAGWRKQEVNDAV